jgi:hypothetical protein
MNIKEAIKKLESSDEFKVWKKDNPESFMSFCFKIDEPDKSDEWQLGFYNKNNTITPFILSKDAINAAEPSEIFKEPETKIVALDIKKISIDEKQALDIAKDYMNKNIPTEQVDKEIIILQVIDEVQVYNITLITKTFKTVNIRINSNDKKIVSTKISSLMDLVQTKNSQN